MREQPIDQFHFITEVAAAAADWQEWLAQKQVGRLLKAITNLPPSVERERTILRSQIYRALGLRQQARDEFVHMDVDDVDHQTLLRWADLARYAGAGTEAIAMISRVVDQLTDPAHLEQALDIAWSIGDFELADRVQQSLGKKSPNSTVPSMRASAISQHTPIASWLRERRSMISPIPSEKRSISDVSRISITMAWTG